MSFTLEFEPLGVRLLGEEPLTLLEAARLADIYLRSDCGGKGAIRAGIDILMEYLKVKADEIDEIVIAGAFGTYMNPEHAVRIGMLADIPLERIHTVGNAAGVGARMRLVSTKMRVKALGLAKKIEYLELTIYPDFDLFFARGIQA